MFRFKVLIVISLLYLSVVSAQRTPPRANKKIFTVQEKLVIKKIKQIENSLIESSDFSDIIQQKVSEVASFHDLLKKRTLNKINISKRILNKMKPIQNSKRNNLQRQLPNLNNKAQKNKTQKNIEASQKDSKLTIAMTSKIKKEDYIIDEDKISMALLRYERKEIEKMIMIVKSQEDRYESNKEDQIFIRITKAYMRSLPRLLK